MKINPKYGDRIITIPASAVLDCLPSVDGDELKVLIFVLANQNATSKEIENGTGLSKTAVTNALYNWKERGVISCVGLKKSKTIDENDSADADCENTEPESEKKPRILLSSELPSYSSDRINDLIEKNEKIVSIIDECQNISGHVFNVTESSSIVRMLDYYRIPPEYIFLVIQHSANKLGDNISIRYIEKTIASLYDNNIITFDDLEAHYKLEEAALSLEGKFKKLIGAGSRSLSKKELALLEKWISFGYEFEIIEKAFEITVDSADKFSTAYMDAIISRWHDEGCKTMEEIEKSLNAHKNEAITKRQNKNKNKNKTAPADGGSFDTDDFFEKALERSYNT